MLGIAMLGMAVCLIWTRLLPASNLGSKVGDLLYTGMVPDAKTEIPVNCTSTGAS